MFGYGCYLLWQYLVWVKVLCWIDRVWSSKECVCCACDHSVHLSVPGSKRHRLHVVELSQWSGKPCANCVDPSRPQQWGPDYRFLASRPCTPAGWQAMLLIKAGNVETNPGPTTTRKQVGICDICHRQIQVRKQISIRCNRIEHWVHLRCTGIRLAHYTETWTCHLRR